MTVTIPTWLCWTIGIIVGLPLLFFLMMALFIGGYLIIDFIRGEYFK